MRLGAELAAEESSGCAGEWSLVKLLGKGGKGAAFTFWVVGPARASVEEDSTGYSGNLRYTDMWKNVPEM